MRALSPETIVLRYFGPHPQMSPKEVEALTTPDGIDVVVLIAECRDLIIAIAQYFRLPGRDEAEVAFLVDDSYQGHGIGTILLEHLASEARRHGIRRFEADTLAENHKMLRVFADAGFVRQYHRECRGDPGRPRYRTYPRSRGRRRGSGPHRHRSVRWRVCSSPTRSQ